MVNAIAEFEVGAAVVERAAVGGPEGIDLKLGGVGLDGGHLVFLHVVGNEVAGGIEHLNLVAVGSMKALSGVVRRKDHEGQRGVPCGIDAGRDDAVVAHVDLAHLTVVGNDGAAHILAGVKEHAVGVVLLIVVAVDALPTLLGAAQQVVHHHALVVVLQAALVQGEIFVGDVGGRDESVAEPGVDAIRRHVEGKRLIALPLIVAIAGIDIDGDVAALGLLEQLVPFVDVGLHLVAAHNQFVIAARKSGHHLEGVVVHHKREGRYVHGDGHVGVVGIDIGLSVDGGISLGHTGAAARHQREDGHEGVYQVFHRFNKSFGF